MNSEKYIKPKKAKTPSKITAPVKDKWGQPPFLCNLLFPVFDEYLLA
jgi:hypothetical protein